MIVHLPDPVGLRVIDVAGDQVTFRLRDAGHRDAYEALFSKALARGYAVEVKLIQYEGQPDMVEQAAARKARK